MTKAIVTICFLAAFAAGLAVGNKMHRIAPPLATRPSHRSGWLAVELGLNAQQQEQLTRIWSETAGRGGRERDDRHKQYAEARDQAISALIRPEDKGGYEEIRKRYADQIAAMDREWRDSFQAAVERTKRILTPEQRVKYDKLLQRHEEERGSRGGGWRRGDRDREGGKSRGAPATSRTSS